jgi:uncharacterized protein
MSLSARQSSVGAYVVTLQAFSNILDKAQAHAEAKKFDSAIYLTLRMRPDMMPFARQVQSFCDHAKNSSSRLAGVEPPRFEDNEASIAELKTRIQKTLDHIATLDAAALEAGLEKELILPLGPNKAKIRGDNYLLHFALPNYYFHLTTAYDLLRYAGVDIGKRDFLGAVPGFQLV